MLLNVPGFFRTNLLIYGPRALKGTSNMNTMNLILTIVQVLCGLAVIAVVMLQSGILGGSANISLPLGLAIFSACLPVGIVGLVSGIHQGKVAAAGVSIVAKRPDQVAKAIVSAALVETYAILALLISLLLVLNIH